MTSLLKTTLLAATLSTAFAAPAFAQQALVPAQSAIHFEAKQMGVPMQGHFQKFDAKISFDAAKLSGQTVVIDADYVDQRLQVLSKDEDLSRFIL